MKHRTIALAMAAALLLPLASCVKEADNRPADANGHFKTFALDVAEEPGGAKALISGLKTYWENTDSVWINGDKKRIQVTNTGRALLTYVENVPSNNHHFYAFFPTTLLGSDELVQNQFTFDDDLVQTTIVYPSHYTVVEKQFSAGGTSYTGFSCRELPLVAMADSASDALVFEHLTAEVTLLLDNLTGNIITIDSVEFMFENADNLPLAGPGLLTLDKTQHAGSHRDNILMEWADGSSSNKVTVLPRQKNTDGTLGKYTLARSGKVSIPILVAPVGTYLGIPRVTVYTNLGSATLSRTNGTTNANSAVSCSLEAGKRIKAPFKLRKDYFTTSGIPGLETGNSLW